MGYSGCTHVRDGGHYPLDVVGLFPLLQHGYRMTGVAGRPGSYIVTISSRITLRRVGQSVCHTENELRLNMATHVGGKCSLWGSHISVLNG